MRILQNIKISQYNRKGQGILLKEVIERDALSDGGAI